MPPGVEVKEKSHRDFRVCAIGKGNCGQDSAKLLRGLGKFDETVM
jgi:hypothetical protein